MLLVNRGASAEPYQSLSYGNISVPAGKQLLVPDAKLLISLSLSFLCGIKKKNYSTYLINLLLTLNEIIYIQFYHSSQHRIKAQ